MTISFGNGCANINGQPTFIYSGELIGYRLPGALWKDRLEKLKAGSLNTVSVYWAWNFHSASHGVVDVTSPDRDVAKFLELAQAAGLYVIARPGPYVCNEWDLGGYPAWLLKEDSGDWRSDDPRHLRFCREWFRQIHRELSRFQQDRGGPIIMEQIENEHRWAARNFLGTLCDYAREDGMTVPLIGNHDGGGVCAADKLTDGCDLYTGTLEFYRWRGWLESHARRIGPDKPLMVLEYRCGDGQAWGSAPVLPRWEPIDWYISQDRLFMGLGANVLNHFVGAGGITPVGYFDDARVTSYGDNAPIAPWGELTPLFYEMRLLGECIASCNTALAMARPWSIGWGTDNIEVECLARRGADGLFLVTANHSNLPQEFVITLPDGRRLPEQGRLAIAPYRTQMLLADIQLGGGLTLKFCTQQLLKYWQSGQSTSMVVYGAVDAQGYLQLEAEGNTLIVPFCVGVEVSRQAVECGGHEVSVYVVTQATAERSWFIQSDNGTTVPVFGNLDLLRWQQHAAEPARGELPAGQALQLVFPDEVKAVQVNGQVVALTAGTQGLKTLRMDMPVATLATTALGPPEMRVEAPWEQEKPTTENGWRNAVAWGPNAEVLLEPSTYEWMKHFDIAGKLPTTLEFMGITNAEIAVCLNGQYLGVYPECRLAGTNDRRSFNAIFNVEGVICPGSNTLAVRMSFPGRHNSGQPIFAGLSQPVVLRSGPAAAEPIRIWKVSPVSRRKWLVSELDALTGPPEAASPWTEIDLAMPNLHRHDAGSWNWREARWYQAEVKIPAALRSRPLFLECPPVEEAWLYAGGRCLGHTRMASSTIFDLSALSELPEITLTLAVRYNWYGYSTGIGLAGAPRLLTADQVLNADWWLRPGSQGLRERWFAPPTAERMAAAGWHPVTTATGPVRRIWYRQTVRANKPAGIAAPLYVEIRDFHKHATIYWNGRPLGLYASVGPQTKFFIPDDQLQTENQLALVVDGYDGPARCGSVSVGYYHQSVERTLTVSL